MTEIELTQAIRDYIQTLYKACFIGWLKVEKLYPGYKLSIGIPSYMFPTTIAGDWETDEEFLNYIYEEFRTRNYMRVYFYQVHRTTRNEEDGRSSEQPKIPQRPTCDPNYTDYDGILAEHSPLEVLYYGPLYNWYAASYNVNGVSIAPPGWRLPTEADFEILVGGTDDYWEADGGENFKSKTGWFERPGNNSNGFNMPHSGWRSYLDPGFSRRGDVGIIWGNNYNGSMAFLLEFFSKSNKMLVPVNSYYFGASIRLIKEDSNNTGTMIDIDGNVYPTVTINGQVWMAENLRVTHYNDGTLIPIVTEESKWITQTTGAMCCLNNDPKTQ